MRKIIYIAIAIIYFISPIDILPDFAGLIARVDDILVAVLLYWHYQKLFREKISNLKREFQSEKEQAKRSENESAPKSAFEILGVSKEASAKEIRKAYRALVSKYHPDKVSHLGDEFQKLAHDKMLAIQKAYAELSK